MHINQTPLDCLREIFGFLDLPEICSISPTSKRFDSVGDIFISALEEVVWPKDEGLQKILKSMMFSGKMVKLRRVTRIHPTYLDRLGRRCVTSCPRLETIGTWKARTLLPKLPDFISRQKKHASFIVEHLSDVNSNYQPMLACIAKLPCLETLCLTVNPDTLSQIQEQINNKLSTTLKRLMYYFHPFYARRTIRSPQCLSFTNLQILRISYRGHFPNLNSLVSNLPVSLKLFIVDVDIRALEYPVVEDLANIFNMLLPVLNKSYSIEILDEGIIPSTFHELAIPDNLTVQFSIMRARREYNVLEMFLHTFRQHAFDNVISLNFEEQGWREPNLSTIHQCFPNLQYLIHRGRSVGNHSALVNLKELTIHGDYAYRLAGEFSVRKLTLSDQRVSTATVDSLLQNCQWPNLTDISFEIDNAKDSRTLKALAKVIGKHPNLKNVEIRNLNRPFSSIMSMSD
eukprot:896556_1